MRGSIGLSVLSLLTRGAQSSTEAPSTTLPIVDLSYELHQAISFNATAGYYTFSNIRYAQPPVDDLRFRAPLPPKRDRSVIKNGSAPRTCPQGIPVWQANVLEVIGEYLGGKPYTLAGWEADIANASFPVPDVNNGTTEDCLFLDVVVPEKILERGQKVSKLSEGAPVLVWIHGGGFALGSKTGTGGDDYDPSSLIAESKLGGSEGMIFVALNYRLGALGWLAGPTLQADGTQNAGLYDQRLALEWIQDNIHLFGGDKKRVTVMGESAGGSSTIMQITAYGGTKGPAPFAQAITQSPGFLINPSPIQAEDDLKRFLILLNVSSIDAARRLPSDAIIAANAKQISASNYSTYTFGPVVDGVIMPALPGQLLLDGKFDTRVRAMTGHNSGEGLFFFDPKAKNPPAFAAWLAGVLPNLAPAAKDHIVDTLYPPVFDGSFGYVDEFGRQSALFAESVFTCNDYFLTRALKNQTYAYEFSVAPGLHTEDLRYTFFPARPVLNNTVATVMQQYISSFVVGGVPKANGGGVDAFPTYGSEMRQVNLTADGIYLTTDDVFVDRCLWWQQGLLS